MKKFSAMLLALCMVQLATAQSGKPTGSGFKPFKVDISLGYAAPASSDMKAGVIFVIEPKYAVMQQLAVGLRMEGAGLANIDINGEKGKVRILASGLATGDYYLGNKSFRPFVGAGAGLFRMASIEVDGSTQKIPASSEFGFMTRAGFEYGHFRLGAEYNFLKNKAGYFGIKIGACIGGGSK